MCWWRKFENWSRKSVPSFECQKFHHPKQGSGLVPFQLAYLTLL
jgi:hypothetical protein